MPDAETLAAAASWLESLEAGGPMPSREALINLLSSLLQAPVQSTLLRVPVQTLSDPGEAWLIQDLNAPTSFPHVVEIAGAPVHPEHNVWHGSRHQREDAQWQQCATKMTRFGLRLVDGQGSMVKGQSPVRLAGVPQLATGAAVCLAKSRFTAHLPLTIQARRGYPRQHAAAGACAMRPLDQG